MGTSVRPLADGRITVVALDAAHKAADPKNPTVDELNAGQRLEMYVMKSDYKLGSKGSTSVEEPVLGAQGKGTVPGPAEYEGQMSVTTASTPPATTTRPGSCCPRPDASSTFTSAKASCPLRRSPLVTASTGTTSPPASRRNRTIAPPTRSGQSPCSSLTHWRTALFSVAALQPPRLSRRSTRRARRPATRS